jgi:hypothetical protein
MMKHLQQIGVSMWAFYFLLSTTGVSLQHLYCHCANIEQVSLFAIDYKCETHQKEKVLSPCCAKLLACEKTAKEAAHPKDCCDPSTEYIKADIDILVISELPELPTIDISTPLISIAFSSFSIIKDNSFFQSFHHPPPRRYGIALRHFIQSYLC